MDSNIEINLDNTPEKKSEGFFSKKDQEIEEELEHFLRGEEAYTPSKDPESKLLSASEKPSNPSVFSIEYFSEYFDVSTDTVMSRIKFALWPFRTEKIFEAGRFDLYGPVWIFISLITVISMVGTIHAGTATTGSNASAAFNVFVSCLSISSFVFFV